MERLALFDRLHHHQLLAQDILTRVAACIEDEPDIALPALADLRPEMTQVLRDYQVFKHEGIFDPAVTSGSPRLSTRAKAMKVDCIAAGETFRAHLTYWQHRDIVGQWESYQASARLTINQLKRHIAEERDGIVILLTMIEVDA